MDLTNNEIVNAMQALALFNGRVSDVVVSFRFSQAQKTLATLFETWQEARQEIVSKYAELDKDGKPKTEGNQFVWKAGEEETAIGELTELGELESNVDVAPVKLSRLAESMSEPVAFAAIEAIVFMIEDDIDE